MAEYTIDKFSYGGNTYKLQDNISGYVTASGAASAAPVQSVSVTQVHTTGTEIAQVSVNGTSTSLYAPSGGTALTDPEIEAAVEEAFPSYSITISITNPLHSSYFESFKVYDRPTSSYEKGIQIGEIASATGETTVNISFDSYGIIVEMKSSGALFYPSPTCTGGVAVDTSYGSLFFIVTGNGTIVYDGIDWDD